MDVLNNFFNNPLKPEYLKPKKNKREKITNIFYGKIRLKLYLILGLVIIHFIMIMNHPQIQSKFVLSNLI